MNKSNPLHIILMALIVTISWPSQKAMADWQEVGNGGHVLVCANIKGSGGGHGRLLNMYDFIETEIRYGLTPQIPEMYADENLTPLEIRMASAMLDRIQGVDASWLSHAHHLIDAFYDEARLMNGVDLVMVADTGMGFIPVDCVLKQLFLQSPPISSDDRYYKVNNDIWRSMFPEQRATGILHEVLYRLSPESRARFSSEKVRYVVALLLADKFKEKTPSEIQIILKDAGLQ